MRFQLVLTNLSVYIFTTPSTFHGTPILNHVLEIINWTNITIDFLGNATMNKIVGAATINENHGFSVVNVAN
jgi:hypothetical protein